MHLPSDEGLGLQALSEEMYRAKESNTTLQLFPIKLASISQL
jgi:hypothetical protein